MSTIQVSEQDAGLLLAHNWWINSNGYAAAYIAGKTVLMHRLILGASPSEQVDHANGDRLDNRRANLRIATHAENMRNSKLRSHNKLGVKGVCWDGRSFRARIRVDGRQRWLGRFKTVEAAHAAYNAAAIEHFGAFARIQEQQ